jgi:hypothetical protein
MTDLVIVVPSRGRPGKMFELADAFEATCTADTALVVSLDSDDKRVDEYVDDRYAYRFVQPNTSMVEALNRGVLMAHGFAPSFAVGFMGDDHRPRSKGWDQAYLDALRELGTGIVYGDDLLQHEKLPTQCAMTSNIVQELGWMAPPSLKHMFVDNWWLELGKGAECLRYLPDVVVEHEHPHAGKTEWDDGYRRVNAKPVYQRDGFQFDLLRARELPAAVQKVRALR